LSRLSTSSWLRTSPLISHSVARQSESVKR
jgi:hypothetical protein